MSTKTMDDLRAHLFAALDGLRNKSMDVSTAKAMCEVGQTIVNTAKAEADFARATGGRVISNLIPASEEAASPSATNVTRIATATATGVKEVEGNVTRHRLK